jgi:ribonuclease HI
MTSPLRIYTDGACRGNPGPGGWGVYSETDQKEICGFEQNTTNNRMELQAVIRAFDLLYDYQKGCHKIYTDSQYVYKGITQWRHTWKANNWTNSKKKKIENMDLWRQLDLLVEAYPNTTYEWVRAHNGNEGNERADKLATAPFR